MSYRYRVLPTADARSGWPIAVHVRYGELAAALSRLNDLLAALESYADTGCMSALWFCIRRYDRLHTVADTANE